MRTATAALALAAGLAAAGAQAQPWPGAPPISGETQAAIDEAVGGSPAKLARLADEGRADAQVFASVFLIFGANGFPKDGARGCAYAASASATRFDAMHLVAECYQYGYGGEKDLEKAIATFHKAGDMGSAKSRCAEGNVLIELNRDIARAVALCREGAEAGDRDAQTDLGNLYLFGKVIPRDVAAARSWYEKAAAQKQANAAHVLGQIYWNGDGVPRDIDRAAELWRISFAGGREDSAYHLGNVAFLKAGRGDRKWDPAGLAEARDWYAKAVDARNPEIAKRAREQRDLSEQLIGVMKRQGR